MTSCGWSNRAFCQQNWLEAACRTTGLPWWSDWMSGAAGHRRHGFTDFAVLTSNDFHVSFLLSFFFFSIWKFEIQRPLITWKEVDVSHEGYCRDAKRAFVATLPHSWLVKKETSCFTFSSTDWSYDTSRSDWHHLKMDQEVLKHKRQIWIVMLLGPQGETFKHTQPLTSPVCRSWRLQLESCAVHLVQCVAYSKQWPSCLWWPQSGPVRRSLEGVFSGALSYTSYEPRNEVNSNTINIYII